MFHVISTSRTDRQTDRQLAVAISRSAYHRVPSRGKTRSQAVEVR